MNWIGDEWFIDRVKGRTHKWGARTQIETRIGGQSEELPSF